MLASAGVDLERQLEDKNVNLLGVVLGLRRSLSLSIAWRSRAAVASASRRTATSASRRDSSIEASIWTRSVLLEQGLTLRAHAQLAAQVLTGALFGAFTKRSDSLEPERERGGLHDGSIGKWGPDLK